MTKVINPSLYQINTRVWLTELSRKLGRAATLDDVPDAGLDRLAGMGFDWVWFLSVWQTGPAAQQVGPAALVGYLSKKWILGAIVQNWTSFGGSGNWADTNQMNLQPVAAYFLPNGWSIGYSGNVLANWKAAKDGDTWTVPLGLSVSKVLKLGKLPVKIALAGQYMVHHPDTFGQKWNIQLMVVPVIPKLIKGNLFGE